MNHSTQTILVVDDDIALRTAFARLLDRAGYDAVTATGSTSVVDLISEHGPQLLLMDNHMPGATGIDLIKLIRRRWSPEDLPIILISGSSIQGEIDQALQCGANEFRRKPVDFEVLLAAVRKALGPSSIDEEGFQQ